jgi:hypothetical protein
MTMLDRGIDLLKEGITPEEVAAFKESYISRQGAEHPGLTFLLVQRPDALKAFRLYVRTAYEHQGADEALFSVGPGFFLYYAHRGYEAGVRYLVRGLQAAGYSREDILDLFGLAGLVLGPAGFETIARALEGSSLVERESALTVPAAWDPSLDELAAGIDLREPRLLPGEADLIEAWYERVLGEVPAWVPFSARHHPDVLKVQRRRFETALRVLPKQTLPLSMLHLRLMRGDVETIRENVLMARGFGVAKDQVVRTIYGAIEYGGEESIAAAAARVADVLDTWPV